MLFTATSPTVHHFLACRGTLLHMPCCQPRHLVLGNPQSSLLVQATASHLLVISALWLPKEIL